MHYLRKGVECRVEDTKEPREPGYEAYRGQLEDSLDYFGEVEFFDGSDGVV